MNITLNHRSILLVFVLLVGGCDRSKTPQQVDGRSGPADQAITTSPEAKAISDRSDPDTGQDARPKANDDLQAIPPSDASGQSIRILAWNIESEGADPQVIASQLTHMPRYDLYGFTEVKREEWPAIKEALGDGFEYWYSNSGWDDRTAYAVSKHRFEVLRHYEMEEFEGHTLNPGNYRSPHVYEVHDRATEVTFVVVLNHLARGKAEIRQAQAEGLRVWAQSVSMPLIAIGDYNFDYVFETEKGNAAFDIFMAEDVFTWVKPEPLIDSNWYDGDGDGADDYPGSILDFAFVCGEAKNWNPKSTVVVREGDFPDDETTSDHRPITLTLTP